jgi:hypothetical protein
VTVADYHVEVVMGTVDGAGTNADVYIQLNSPTGGSTEATKLDNLGNDFEEGGTYGFDLTGVASVGDLNYVQMWHQGGESAAEMYVSTVTVTDHAADKTYTFDYNGWIDNDVHVLMPAPGQEASYKVQVYTGDVHNAGTNANIYLTVTGEYGNSGRYLLDNDDNNFEQDQTDTFTLNLAEFGTLQKIFVESDNSGSASGWYLSTVTVTDETTGKWWKFVYNNWLEDDTLTCTLTPSSFG